MTKQLRIALTLPAEASLGAFEAGAVAALLIGLQKINSRSPDRVRVDAITGASSGSLTAVLAARALVAGDDPIAPLRRAWVTEPTVDALMGRDRWAPLSLERAREVARELLQRTASTNGHGPRQASVTVELALTSLRGFAYSIRRWHRDARHELRSPISATSYLDWATHELTDAEGLSEEWAEAVESAIASASHPAAFAPTLLTRRRSEYVRNGVTNFPTCPRLWYTDGGLLDREPLGRCIKLVRELDRGTDEGSQRLVLVIRPDADHGIARDDPAWTEAAEPPRWTTAFGRALRLVARHSLYEDLRKVEKTNNRIVWKEDLQATLVDLLADCPGAEARLQEVVDRIDADRRRWRLGQPDGSREVPNTVPELLDHALAAAAGLVSKRTIEIGVISARDPRRLAGGALLQFGGFLAERLRASDFLLGYREMVVWMQTGLAEHGVDANDAEAAVRAAHARGVEIPGWIGGVEPGRRRLRATVDVLKVAGRAVTIGLRGTPAPPKM